MIKMRHNFRKNRGLGYYTTWFLFWFLLYGVLIWLFELVRVKYGLLDKPIAHYLVLGLFVRITSKFVFCAVKKSRFTFKRIFSWGIIYAILFFIINFLLNEFTSFNSQYIHLAITSAVFTCFVTFLRRTNISFGRLGIRNKWSRRAPSQILNGIILIVLGILCWRFSTIVFIDWIGWAEGMAWSWLIGLGLIIAGVLVIIAWWRNNVATFGIWNKIKRN